MAYDIETEVSIASPPAAVWEILADFPKYPEWNPFILKVEGDVRLGAAARYRFEFPRGLRIWAVARILMFDPARELLWTAHALSDTLLRGDHHFRIEPINGGSRFCHGEHFTGALLPLVAPILKLHGPEVYSSLNQALKRRAERRQALPLLAPANNPGVHNDQPPRHAPHRP
jgi:hypothetical protein